MWLKNISSWGLDLYQHSYVPFVQQPYNGTAQHPKNPTASQANKLEVSH